MYCSRCGAEIPEGTLFCEKCGRRITAPFGGRNVTAHTKGAAGEVQRDSSATDAKVQNDSDKPAVRPLHYSDLDRRLLCIAGALAIFVGVFTLYNVMSESHAGFDGMMDTLASSLGRLGNVERIAGLALFIAPVIWVGIGSVINGIISIAEVMMSRRIGKASPATSYLASLAPTVIYWVLSILLGGLPQTDGLVEALRASICALSPWTTGVSVVLAVAFALVAVVEAKEHARRE